MKKAYTLAECLIVIVLIGVIMALLISTLRAIQPDKEKVMFKKAYSITERAVGELVNDETIYPYDPENIGFRNITSADIEGTDEKYDNAQKFCQFFARKLNTFEPAVFDAANSLCTFQTTDSINWTVMSDFQDTTERVAILVDVNGNDNGPNVPNYTLSNVVANEGLLNLTTSQDVNLDRNDRDRYYIYVHFDGRVTVPANSKEQEFLRTHNPNEDE